MAAVDVVVTKPGYGIISECLANDTALLYTDRGHFIEYDVLVREMPRHVRCAYLPQAEMLQRTLAGRARPRRGGAPPEAPLATDGAAVAADWIVSAARLTTAGGTSDAGRYTPPWSPIPGPRSGALR